MAMKMRLKIWKMKSRSQGNDINRPMPRHGYEYIKYKMCLSIIMVSGVKQHLNNI